MAWRWNERSRRFAREVGSVVLGVLIALGLGEAAEAVRWQIRVARTSTAMRVEAAGNRYNIVERAATQPCIDRRLARLESLLADARRNGSMPPVGRIGVPPDRVVERAAYDVAIGQGVLLHLDPDDARDAALIYQVTTAEFADRAATERAAWQRLDLLRASAGPVDGDTLLALRQAVSDARAASAAVLPVVARSEKLFAALRVPIEYGEHRDAAGLARTVARSDICQPL